MNATQRELLKNTIAKIKACEATILQLRTEEQEKFANLTDGLQQTEAGEQLDVNADVLENVSDDLKNAISLLDNL